MTDNDLNWRTCQCGHLGLDHSDLDLDALGDCYLCDDCEEFADAG